MKSFTTLAALSVYLFLHVNAQLLAGQTNQIQNVVGSTSCMTASSNADGATVVFQACPNITAANSWVISGGQNQAGTLKIFGDKCLDVKDGVNADGTKLQIWTCAAGNTNQQFEVAGQQIEWVGKGKCLDLTDGKTNDGNVLQVWTCANGPTNDNQKWNEIGLNQPKSFQIGWKSNPNLCVTGSSNAVNASVVIDNCANPKGNSTWHFIQQPNTGGRNEVAIYDNLCMTAAAGISDGGKLVLQPCGNDQSSQGWGVNTGTIHSQLFGKLCLDLTDGNSTIGNQFQTWECNEDVSGLGDNPNQDFVVKFTF